MRAKVFKFDDNPPDLKLSEINQAAKKKIYAVMQSIRDAEQPFMTGFNAFFNGHRTTFKFKNQENKSIRKSVTLTPTMHAIWQIYSDLATDKTVSIAEAAVLVELKLRKADKKHNPEVSDFWIKPSAKQQIYAQANVVSDDKHIQAENYFKKQCENLAKFMKEKEDWQPKDNIIKVNINTLGEGNLVITKKIVFSETMRDMYEIYIQQAKEQTQSWQTTLRDMVQLAKGAVKNEKNKDSNCATFYTEVVQSFSGIFINIDAAQQLKDIITDICQHSYMGSEENCPFHLSKIVNPFYADAPEEEKSHHHQWLFAPEPFKKMLDLYRGHLQDKISMPAIDILEGIKKIAVDEKEKLSEPYSKVTFKIYTNIIKGKYKTYADDSDTALQIRREERAAQKELDRIVNAIYRESHTEKQFGLNKFDFSKFNPITMYETKYVSNHAKQILESYQDYYLNSHKHIHTTAVTTLKAVRRIAGDAVKNKPFLTSRSKGMELLYTIVSSPSDNHVQKFGTEQERQNILIIKQKLKGTVGKHAEAMKRIMELYEKKQELSFPVCPIETIKALVNKAEEAIAHPPFGQKFFNRRSQAMQTFYEDVFKMAGEVVENPDLSDSEGPDSYHNPYDIFSNQPKSSLFGK